MPQFWSLSSDYYAYENRLPSRHLLDCLYASQYPWSSVAVLLAFLSYGGAVISFTLMYRLSPFHPLAKYPGPVMAKASKLWAACLSGTADMHRHHKSLHERHGDVVRTVILHVCAVLSYP